MGERSERSLDLGDRDVTECFDPGDGQRSLGDRAGLVGAQHVDPSEHLDRRQFLHEATLFGEAHDADGEGDAGEEHESLGHHADEARDERRRRGGLERRDDGLGAATLGA